MKPQLRIVAASVALWGTIVACGDSEQRRARRRCASRPAVNGTPTNPRNGEFCDAMAHLIVLLAPAENSSPDATEATFAEAAGWFEQANSAAPAAIAADFATYKTAYDEYVHYLSTVDFNLDAVFSTSEGKRLAIDTSHTLTPAIVEHVVRECGPVVRRRTARTPGHDARVIGAGPRRSGAGVVFGGDPPKSTRAADRSSTFRRREPPHSRPSRGGARRRAVHPPAGRFDGRAGITGHRACRGDRPRRRHLRQRSRCTGS